MRQIFGLGLRSKYHNLFLENDFSDKLDFLEIHSENYIAEGGFLINFLSHIKQKYKISMHSIGMSIGSDSFPNISHLQKIKNLTDKFDPFLFSDHISYSYHDNNNIHNTVNDLLPLSYNKDNLQKFINNIKFIQDFFGRNILIENPSLYLSFNDSYLKETDFINEILVKSNCYLLLDVNNIYVTSNNLGSDPELYIDEINKDKIKEIHLAGYENYNKDSNILIDSHNNKISKEVMLLYKYLLSSMTNIDKEIAILFEWDQDLPEFDILLAELDKIKIFHYNDK